MSEKKWITVEELKLLNSLNKPRKSTIPHKYIYLPINRKFIGMTKKEREEYEKSNMEVVKQNTRS